VPADPHAVICRAQLASLGFGHSFGSLQ
jgi:hypothetical protein